MKGTLPDNNPLVQQIVTLLKKTDKKVLKQIANADIKYLSDKAKDILGEEKITESKKRRFTVKEVRMWMKKLEENRYKKVYNSDARRVAWMVNNEGVSLDEMPISMKKKWTKAQYGRERYLATEFLKSKSEQMNESVWSLPKGATTTSVDELDADLSRAGIKSKPDFTRLLVQVDGNKSKINKIMKRHKAKKIFEGKLTERTYVSNVKKVGKLQKWTIVKGGKKVDVLGSKKFFDDGRGFSTNDPDDALELWNLGKKFKGKQVPDVYGEGKLTSEQKLREQIREIIKEQLNEKKETNFQMNTRDMREVDKLLKKGKFKGLKMKAKGPKFILTVPKKMEDNVLSYLIQKNIKNINEV